MKITEFAEIKDVKIFEPVYYGDNRGWFAETYSYKTLKENGIDIVFVQDNHSFSAYKGTIRGFHFQKSPSAQTKIVRCIKGEILDVAVDLRKNSPTYKKFVSEILSESNRKQLFIPAGFAHGFLTLTDNCEICYKVDKFYNTDDDRSIAWNDPEIGFDWQIKNPILSLKDQNAPLLKDSDVNF